MHLVIKRLLKIKKQTESNAKHEKINALRKRQSGKKKKKIILYRGPGKGR